MIPFRFLSDERFAFLRAVFVEGGFEHDRIAQRLGLSKLSEIASISDQALPEQEPEDALGVLIRLFIELGPVSEKALFEKLGKENGELLVEFGLADLYPFSAGYVASVGLYPVAGNLIVSDRWRAPDDSKFRVPADFVYPAIIGNTQDFLRSMPQTECEDFVELCGGAGAAALMAASEFARQVWCLDIAGRSCRFAEFNRRLNGITNVIVLQGDLFEPVEGRKFDRIVAHPPYMPVLEPKWIYHDGGNDGEQVVRRLVEGLPKHLKRGGSCYILTMGTDRSEAPYENRIREWLGQEQEQFDIALVVRRVLDPAQYAIRSVLKGAAAPTDILRWKELFENMKVTGLPYTYLWIQRKAENRPAFTVRRQEGERTTRTEMEWMVAWETDAADAEGILKILRSRLRAAPGAELRVKHKVQDGDWTATEYDVIIDYPFSMQATITPWIALLISRCDGTRTGQQLLEDCIRDETVLPGTQPVEFASALLPLVSGGFILLEDPVSRNGKSHPASGSRMTNSN